MNTTVEDHIRLLDVLLTIRDIKDKEDIIGYNFFSSGLCGLVETLSVDSKPLLTLMKDLWKDWEYYTGSNAFPVPFSKEDESMGWDYTTRFLHWGETPKWEGEYGKLREELLDYLINELQGILHV